MDELQLLAGQEIALGRHRYRILGGPLPSRTTTMRQVCLSYGASRFPRPQVYRARMLRGGERTAALKVAAREVEPALRVEYEALRKLRSTNLAPSALHPVSRYDGLNILAIEWLDAETWTPLAERLDDWHTELPDQSAFSRVLLHSLRRLHAAGVAHGDLTDANIFVSQDWSQVQFIDFGMSIVGHLPRQARGGTVGFSAPELAQLDEEQDLMRLQQADVYAACAVLYYLITEQCYPMCGSIYQTLKRYETVELYETAAHRVADMLLRPGVLDEELVEVLLDGLRGDSGRRPTVEALLSRLPAEGARPSVL